MNTKPIVYAICAHFRDWGKTQQDATDLLPCSVDLYCTISRLRLPIQSIPLMTIGSLFVIFSSGNILDK